MAIQHLNITYLKLPSKNDVHLYDIACMCDTIMCVRLYVLFSVGSIELSSSQFLPVPSRIVDCVSMCMSVDNIENCL